MRTLLAGIAGLLLTVIAPLTLAADVQGSQAPVAPTLRLPSGARPTGYALDLTVVPGAPTVTGEIAIGVELDRAQDVLWLNARSLKVTRVATELSDTRVSLLSEDEQFLGLAFTPPLPAGGHRVTVSFEAEQSRKMTQGIFTLEDDGAWYTMTQFEADSARRAFPCFDEPGYKVPWQLTLRVPKELVAVSNTKVVSETPADGGLKVVRFAKTRPLPSYLIAFAVGPWEFVDLGPVGRDPTPSRIIVPHARPAEAAFVARTYPELFTQLETWFGIAYPFDKLDHIAIPLNVGFAMENVGLITYGARGVLAKRDAETARFRHGSVSVGAHEMSHQWFGNLVTTAWWDDIWLNEAFATWIAEKMVDQWRPDYERGAARAEERADAIKADALISARRIREPITSRGDIHTAFDYITYQKGATVISMFEGWVGEDSFRRAVHSYLEARKDSSATAEDFLAALTQTSHRPVAPAFNTFLDQNGVPQVETRLQCGAGGAKLELGQHRLSTVGAEAARVQRWQIPVCVRYGSGDTSRQTCVLMTHARVSVPLKGACPAYVFANSGGRGYYVPSYSRELLDKLAMNRDRLSSGEYTSLLYDVQALVRAGALNAGEAVLWMRLAAGSSDRHVVLAAIDLAEFTGNTLVAEPDRAQFERFVREVFGPRARSLGFVPRPDESDDDQLTRRALLRLVAPVDPELAAEARGLASAWIKDRKAVDPELVDVVLITAGRTGDAAMFGAMLAEAKAAPERLDRYYLRMALFAFTDPPLAAKGMALLLDPDFDVRESWTALYRGYSWNPTRHAVNDFITANFDALAKTVGPDSPAGWPTYASGFCSDDDRRALVAFWKDKTARYAGADREVAQTAETIQICIRLRAKAGRISFAR
jgi:alanyl aminopeptidase